MRKLYHSVKPEIEVYHNNTECWNGNNIEKEYYRTGKGSKKRLCKTCKDLNRKR